MNWRTGLARVRDALSRVRDLGRRRGVSLGYLREHLSPVFVIGANRSGTSVVSSIMAQHVELEGLFGDDSTPRYDAAGHSVGFAESMHVWTELMPDHRERRRHNELPFWALPQYLSQVYRHRAGDDRERFELAWAVERLRRTPRQPLLKDQFNMMRVGLIVDVFPRARFVLVSRRFSSFAQRSVHKWTHDGLGTRLSGDHPRVGFHWHLANLIARYDLETYARNRYAEVWLDVLQQGPQPAQEAFGEASRAIGLQPFKFDCGILEPQWAKPHDDTAGVGDGAFGAVRQIVAFERELLVRMGVASPGEAP